MESKSDNLEETNKKFDSLQATNNDLTIKLNEMTVIIVYSNFKILNLIISL